MAPEQRDDTLVRAASISRVAIAQGWEMRRTAPGAANDPAELTALALEPEWLTASVPGTVADSLRSAGRWDWSNPEQLDASDWWYRCSFRTGDHDTPTELSLGGLATIADVWLNGAHVLHSDNMFLSHSVDVSSLLDDDNELVIRFASQRTVLDERRPRPRWRTRLVSNQNLRWLRTTLLGNMPGWSAAPQAIGPWRDIALVCRGAAGVISRRLHARVDGADGIVSVAARIHVPEGCTLTDARVRVGTMVRRALVRESGKGPVVHATMHIADAELWWPHTHGAQPLYGVDIQLTFDGGSEITLPLGQVGFRTVRLDTDSGDFELSVNGERIFCRGACWSTIDALRLSGSRQDYRAALELARDAGMNMLRVGGTMVYEDDVFYELCDELGILIWQDFMFANMDYPSDDAVFMTTVQREARQVLERIGFRPCIALFCGNSEVAQQAAMLGLGPDTWTNTLFTETLPALVSQHAPRSAYWSSSPSGGVLPFHVNAGDGHYFGHGPYRKPFSDVRASGVRFASESLAFANIPDHHAVESLPCGSAGAGHHPAWKAGIPRDNGATWDFEDVRDHYVAELFGVNPMDVRTSDAERYLALGRVAAGEVMARTVSEWRRSGSRCNGALVWFYRDLRPGAGWGVLDSAGKPKAAYHYLARVCRPVALLISDEGLNGLRIDAVNDGAVPLTGEVRIAVYRGQTRIAQGVRAVTLAPRTTRVLSVDEVIGHFSDINYAYRFGPANHDVVVAALIGSHGRVLSEVFHFPLGLPGARDAVLGARLELNGKDHTLVIRSDEVALAVEIEVRDWIPEDNYFHIAPGSERSVLLRRVRDEARPAGRVTALNARTPILFQAP